MQTFSRIPTLTLGFALSTALFSAPAAHAQMSTPAGFDGTYSGPRAETDGVNLAKHFNAGDNFTLASLSPGQTVTFSTVIQVDSYAANWTDDNSNPAAYGNLIQVGFAVYDPAVSANPVHDTPGGNSSYGDHSTTANVGAPLLFFENNSRRTNAFWNTQFYGATDNDFVFGQGGATQSVPAASRSAQGGSNAQYTVVLSADGTFTETVQYLDYSTGTAIAGASETLTGSVANKPADTIYTPYLRLETGFDTGFDIANPDTPWTFTVSGSTLNLSAAPEPSSVLATVVGVLMLGGLAMRARRRTA